MWSGKIEGMKRKIDAGILEEKNKVGPVPKGAFLTKVC